MTDDLECPDILYANYTRTDPEEPGYGEPEISPFSFGPEDGLLEQVTEAVRPLTADGTFRLATISYNDNGREGGGSVTLVSQNLDISFGFHLQGMKKIACSFKVRTFRELLYAEELFSALHIPVYFRDCRYIPFTDNELRTRYPGEDIFVIRLRETGFVEELYRLCCDLKTHLPAIQAAFLPERSEGTLDRYLAEYLRSYPDRGRFLPGKESGDRIR